MEGGEWSSFNAVCVNEEADFMAQLFPNPNNVDHLTYKNAEHGSYYSSDSHNLYYFSSQESSYNTNKSGHESRSYNSFLSDHHHLHQALATATSNASSLPIDFLQCQMEGDNADNGGGKLDEINSVDLVSEDKNSNSSNNSKKRPRVSDVIPRGKRNVKAKRGQKLTLGGDEEEDENEGGVNGQSSSSRSGSLEDDCSSKGTTTMTALNSNGKTRASRGSATDPQSLYARKRRERINERLRILQSLVPNGTKVDISTMLEEAVHYVKFLQLQIKLLSSDDLWMYAPIAYNGMNIGLDFKINLPR